MKKIIFATLLASVMSIAYAKPYPKHDLSQIVTPRSVNFAVAEQTYLDLKQHAAMYPTTFDNAQDKALATQEAPCRACELDSAQFGRAKYRCCCG